MILHLDMDAFFASVEQMDHPQLAGQPVIIGGNERGVVATASYEARVYGIHSAMPTATAKKLCPHGIFLRGNFRRYSQISRAVMDGLAQFSPLVQQASIDEAYRDISGLGVDWPQIARIGFAVKRVVAEVSGGLTCSIGIAPVKFLAKICSEVNKPDGIFVLSPGQMPAFLGRLEVGKLPGVGRRMKASLNNFGITHVWQLRQLSREFLVEKYGKWGGVLHDRAHGIDPRTVHANEPARSESAESTFAVDTSDPGELKRTILRHADRVGSTLRARGYAGRTITVKIKFSDFRQITRSCTISGRTNSTRAIYDVASALLDEAAIQNPVRLIGVCVSGFERRPEQLILPGVRNFSIPGSSADGTPEEDAEKTARLEHLVDEIRSRYHKKIIGPASLLQVNCESGPHNFEKHV